MPRIRSIAILLHERQRQAERINYRVWAMAETWKARGITVTPVWGIARPADADLLISHVDMSYIPDDYWAFIQGHANVVNRKVRDIRKRRVSANLVGPEDNWDGPVIVKTDSNSRGFTDAWLRAPDRPWTFSRRLRRRLARSAKMERRLLGSAESLNTYHVFQSLKHVPRRAFANPNLVVEKFSPERRGARYILRIFTVFGSFAHVRILEGLDPLVKSWNSDLAEFTEIPPALEAWRRDFGLDYGKIDFVMRDGEPVIIDANTTPTMTGAITEAHIERSAALAGGLEYFETPR